MMRGIKKGAVARQYAALRAELKAKRDYAGLAKLPRNASPVRYMELTHGF
jgi:small subunit ribosomal protein S14